MPKYCRRVLLLIACLFCGAATSADIAFSHTLSINTVSNSHIASGDFNKDGITDIVHARSGKTELWLGTTDHTFQLAGSDTTMIDYPTAVITADMNKDGHLDVVVSSQRGVHIFQGNGAGAIQRTQSAETHKSYRSLAIGDFNQDGYPDIVAVNINDVAVFYNDKSGGTGFPVTYASRADALDVAVEDMNEDGYVDILISSASSTRPMQLMLGTPNGWLSQPTNIVDNIPNYFPSLMRTLDINNDGHQDCISLEMARNRVITLLGNGQGQFSSYIEVSTNTQFHAVTNGMQLGDFNGDGEMDFIIAAGSWRSFYLHIGRGDGSFEPAVILESRGVKSTTEPEIIEASPHSMATGDFNRDGRLDFASTHKNALGTVYLNETLFPQTVNFPAIGQKQFGTTPFAFSATASSGLPVRFEVLSGPVTTNGNMATFTGIGTAVIRAVQDGNHIYSSASAEQSFEIIKGSQTIVLNQPDFSVLPTTQYFLNAQASSGLPVHVIVVSGPAILDGPKITFLEPGEVRVRATQSGNELYNAAAPVEITVLVKKVPQVITFPPLSDVVIGSAPIVLQASAYSQLRVSFTLVGGPARLDGNLLTVTGLGEVSIRADQPGTNMIDTAPGVIRTFRVVAAATAGGQSDSDADGFSDAFEIAVGSSPVDASSTPLNGMPVPPKKDIKNPRLSIRLNFALINKDSIQLNCSLESTGTNFIVVDICGMARIYSLDKNGRGKVGKEQVRVKFSKPGAPPNTKVSIKMQGDYMAKLAESGLSNTTVSGAEVVVPITLMNGSSYHFANLTTTYSAKSGKRGVAIHK